MSILYMLIPLAAVLIAVAVAFFVWSVRSGQFEDLEGPAHRILMDDDDPLDPFNAERRANGPPGSDHANRLTKK